jgi:hypothetical protein
VSLIDEALKRAELEAARRDGLRTGASPWVMENRARRSRWPILAGAVVLLAAAGVAFWLARRPSAVESPKPAAPETSAQSKIQNPKSKIDMETVEVPPPPAAIQPKDPRRPESPAPAAKSEPATPRPARVAEKRPAAPAEERPNAPASAPAAESRNPRGLANGRTYVGEVAIPEGGKIVLEGIVWSEANPVVLINGKVLPPGGIVEEFTVVSIQPDRIELKGRGITIFLALK